MTTLFAPQWENEPSKIAISDVKFISVLRMTAPQFISLFTNGIFSIQKPIVMRPRFSSRYTATNRMSTMFGKVGHGLAPSKFTHVIVGHVSVIRPKMAQYIGRAFNTFFVTLFAAVTTNILSI
ncbi:hypothetical protein B5V02_19530 [Mesorhizobium kowhaii]|uniref:Uncharacterized protein n=1 Tax=Mesorhizobium kowhaii TaxID=1300272 RepID=A0A2W7C1D5_9HYPH|nr:hypothetical protein B5V02_19530 [Mesorhizobium kowhaii]